MASTNNNLRDNYLKSGIVELLPYQQRWVDDMSRFKIGLWSRQSGKTFASTLEACLDAYETGNDWVFLSAGERQSKEMIRKAKAHVMALNMFSDESEALYETKDGTIYKMLEIHLKSGARLIALPANPDTARGNSANLILDEYAFHKDSRAIWSALFPTITRGFKIRILSTPQGRQNKFYEIWTGNPKFSKHKVDIYDAYAQGLKLYGEEGELVDPEFLRETLDDSEAWEQEYLCHFLDEASSWITYDLISEAEDQNLKFENEPEGGPVFAGIDIGRKRDMTIYWSFEMKGELLSSLRIVEIERERLTLQFNRILEEVAKDKPRRICVDGTGIGRQIAEDLQGAYGNDRVELIEFYREMKEDLAIGLKRRFEDHTIAIPVDRRIRDDIHAVRKIVTRAGNARFDAESTKDGHADRFWALALAVHAADTKHIGIPDIKMSVPRIMPSVVAQYDMGLEANLRQYH